MPNCFQLFRKGSDKPESLNKVDEEICSLLGERVHETRYCFGWFDCIGFLIACKNDCELGSEKLRYEVGAWFEHDSADDRYCAMRAILKYLEENYTSNAWVQIGK